MCCGWHNCFIRMRFRFQFHLKSFMVEVCVGVFFSVPFKGLCCPLMVWWPVQDVFLLRKTPQLCDPGQEKVESQRKWMDGFCALFSIYGSGRPVVLISRTGTSTPVSRLANDPGNLDVVKPRWYSLFKAWWTELVWRNGSHAGVGWKERGRRHPGRCDAWRERERIWWCRRFTTCLCEPAHLLKLANDIHHPHTRHQEQSYCCRSTRNVCFSFHVRTSTWTGHLNRATPNWCQLQI